MRIWKYPLALAANQTLAMPPGAKLLTVQMQYGEPALWVLVNEELPDSGSRRIALYGTGGLMPDNPGTYLGTFQVSDGALVFHAFEETP